MGAWSANRVFQSPDLRGAQSRMPFQVRTWLQCYLCGSVVSVLTICSTAKRDDEGFEPRSQRSLRASEGFWAKFGSDFAYRLPGRPFHSPGEN